MTSWTLWSLWQPINLTAWGTLTHKDTYKHTNACILSHMRECNHWESLWMSCLGNRVHNAHLFAHTNAHLPTHGKDWMMCVKSVIYDDKHTQCRPAERAAALQGFTDKQWTRERSLCTDNLELSLGNWSWEARLKSGAAQTRHSSWGIHNRCSELLMGVSNVRQAAGVDQCKLRRWTQTDRGVAYVGELLEFL